MLKTALWVVGTIAAVVIGLNFAASKWPSAVAKIGLAKAPSA